MNATTIRLSLALSLALSAAPALAEQESPEAHAKGVTQTITLDGNDVRPSTTSMSHDDIISFVNYSTHPIEVTFTEPTDLEKKIRCGLVHGKEKTPSAPWAVFNWQDGKLVGDVPPGKFASVCSLEPGTYAFTARIVSHRTVAGGPGNIVPAKGQIQVK